MKYSIIMERFFFQLAVFRQPQFVPQNFWDLRDMPQAGLGFQLKEQMFFLKEIYKPLLMYTFYRSQVFHLATKMIFYSVLPIKTRNTLVTPLLMQ